MSTQIILEEMASSQLNIESTKAMRPQQRRRRLLLWSFWLLVVLPTFLGAIYYSFIASDRYVSGAGFAIRRMGADSGGGDMLGAITGLASTGTTTSDSYIILKYLKSRDLIEKLNEELDLKNKFNHNDIDTLSRLSSDAPIEDVVEYWEKMITTSFDNNSGIITFAIEAFTAQDAQLIAKSVLNHVDDLINRLSEKARQDAVKFAEIEVQRAETRLHKNLQAIRSFREQEKAIDPTRSAQLQIDLLASLEKELLSIRARISTLENSNIDPNSPSLRSLYRQAAALTQQITEINISEESKSSHLSDLLATYESLEIERNFAQQAYASTLSSLEKARAEADRQQRYLAVYSVPLEAEYPLYPRRIVNILILIFSITITWGIGVLLTYSVRDHLS